MSAAQESEEATARLEQCSSDGRRDRQAAKAAEDYASSCRSKIGVEDEVIMRAQAILATFSNVTNETARQAGIFDRATNAAADLAAAGFGSMDRTPMMLGKALKTRSRG